MNMVIDQFHIPDEMRRRYVDRRFKDIQDCHNKLVNLDWIFFERLGHQLKGNALSYGYEDLSEIAFDLEAAALEKDLIKLETCVNAFRQWHQLHQ